MTIEREIKIENKETVKTMICPDTKGCRMTGCWHRHPHELTDGCENACFGNEGCIEVSERAQIKEAMESPGGIKAELIITDNAGETLLAKFDGERFSLVHLLKSSAKTKATILNLREADSLVTFIRTFQELRREYANHGNTYQSTQA